MDDDYTEAKEMPLDLDLCRIKKGLLTRRKKQWRKGYCKQMNDLADLVTRSSMQEMTRAELAEKCRTLVYENLEFIGRMAADEVEDPDE